MPATIRPSLCLMIALMTSFLSRPVLAQTTTTRAAANPFYVIENGVADDKHPTPESQAQMVKELGLDGIGYFGLDKLQERLAALDRRGLKLYTLYVGARLDPDKPKYDPRLPDIIRQLAGRDTMIWLTFQSSKHKPSDPAGDARATEILRELADVAAESRLRIALYPHAGFWMERVEDTVRIARKLGRPNVGVTFNLCHWLRVDTPNTLEDRLRLAQPYLLQVTINGADPRGDWDRLIQPLDRGSFDLSRILKALDRIDYRGPISLQCYNVPGDKYENLKRSMAAWRRLNQQLGRQVPSE